VAALGDACGDARNLRMKNDGHHKEQLSFGLVTKLQARW
jgi:hypothetical protein